MYDMTLFIIYKNCVYTSNRHGIYALHKYTFGKLLLGANLHISSRVFSWSVLIHFSLTVKVATLIFISGRGLAISFAKEGKSGFIYNFVKS